MLEHRIKVGVAASPSTATVVGSKCQVDADETVDGCCEDSSFSAIISEGESSCEEGSDGECSEDSHTMAKDAFISEAKQRQSLDQHCKSVDVLHLHC